MPFLVPRKLPYIWIINESKENTTDGKKKSEILIWQNKSNKEREEKKSFASTFFAKPCSD